MKMGKTLRIAAFGVAVLMVCGCFGGCSKKRVSYTSEYYYEDDNGSGISSGTVTGSSEKEGNGSSVSSGNKNGDGGKDTVETANVKGYTFTLVSSFLPTQASSTSTGFEKNLFNRIKEVEKKFGCTIKIVNSVDTTVDSLQPLIMSGKRVGDAVEVIGTRVLPLAKNNYIIPWNNVPGINLSDSKFVQGYSKMATYDGKVYGVQFMKPAEVRMCVVFNKSILASNGIKANDLYEMATGKKWTFEKLRSYAQKCTSEVNGTTTVWGLGGTPIDVSKALIRANGGLMVAYSGGKASVGYTSKNVVSALDYFYNIVNKDKSYMITDGMGNADTFEKSVPDYNQQFINGKIAFLIAESWVINQQIKGNVSFDYGMLPVPIGSNAKDYIGNADNARVWVMTSTNAKSSDYKKSVFIFNELSKPSSGYEGDDWWGYDVKQEYFQSGSADKDLSMYKLCLDTSSVDVGWGIISMREDFTDTAIYGPVFFNSTTPAAAVSSLTGTYDKTVSAMFNK